MTNQFQEEENNAKLKHNSEDAVKIPIRQGDKRTSKSKSMMQ